MSATTTETTPQVNGDPAYSPKSLSKVTSIPIVNSLKNHIFTHIPQVEVLTKYVGHYLSNAWTYTNDTPIQPMLIKLDTLAANGVARLEKEVPLVTTPTEEVLRKTKIYTYLDFFTHYYTASVDFIFNLLDGYKAAFEPAFNHILNQFEVFLGLEPPKQETKSARVTRIRGAVVEKVDSRVTPILNKTKEVVTSIYSDRIAPLIQYSLNQFNIQKDKAA